MMMEAVVGGAGARIRERLWPLWLGLVVVAILAAVLFLPPVLVAPYGLADAEKRLAAENALRTTMVAVLGGMAVAAGTIVAALNLAHNRRVLEETQRQNRESVELQRRGQVTERFSKAIEQLGQSDDTKLDMRIGAIYALEQIARDSAELHWPIMEVLTAYLRVHMLPRVAADDAPRLPTADHLAIAAVIGRRDWTQESGVRRLNLGGTNLARADLHVAHLSRAILTRADLREADLRGANLDVADLTGADLTGANLHGAYLGGAHLNGANLHGANLSAAHLNGANLKEADLTGANLSAARLNGADLKEADLTGASLNDADLSGARR